MSGFSVRLLRMADAHRLAPLVAAFAQASRRGAPRRPDEYFSETLLTDKTAEIFGVFDGDTLAGFALLVDLPDLVTGMRTGVIKALFAEHSRHGQGVEARLLEGIVSEGISRGWLHLDWQVTENSPVDVAALNITGLDEAAGPSLYRIEIDRPGKVTGKDGAPIG